MEEKEEEEYKEWEEEEKEKISDIDNDNNDNNERRRYSQGSVLGGISHSEAVEGSGGGGGVGGGRRKRRSRRGHQTARCNSAGWFRAKSGGGGANHRHKSMHSLGSGLGRPQQCPCNGE